MYYGLKSIGLKVKIKMKFFNFFIILISSPLMMCSAFLDDALDIPEPFHPLYCQCSMHHNLSPKNAVPNIVSLTQGTPIASDERYDLLAFSPGHLYSPKESILHEGEHGLYLQHLLIFQHSLNCIFELLDPDNVSEYRPPIHDIDTSLSTQYEHSIGLLNENSFDNLSFYKFTKFIETEVSAMELQGFNLLMRQ